MKQDRQVINSEELTKMTMLTPHYEFGCNKCHLHVFTVSGVIKGVPVTGAFFAAEVMVVEAKSAKAAKDLAADGLKSTRDLIVEESFTRPMREIDEDGFEIDVGGQKAEDMGLGDRNLAGMIAASFSRNGNTIH